MIGFLTLTSSSIDAAIAPQAADTLHVSDVVESLTTGMCMSHALHGFVFACRLQPCG